MRNVYTTLLLIFAIAILICSYVISKKDKTELTKAICYIMIAAPLTMAAYAAALLASNLMFAQIMYAVYYTVSDILLINMLLYTLKYTKIFDMHKWQKILLLAIVAVDGALLIVNVFTESVFIFNCGQVDDGSGTVFYGISERGGLYDFHRTFIYAMVILIVIPLVIKIKRSPAMYRKKFWLTLVSLIIIIAANVVYIMTDTAIDFSVLTYGIMAVAIYYFNVIYVPQGLVEGLLSSSIRSMDDSVICFDLDGNCVYANSVAYAFFKAVENVPIVDYLNNWLGDRKLSETSDTEWKESYGKGSLTLHYSKQFKRLCDSEGRCVGCFFKFHDETVDVKKLEIERYRATHDRLTGIYNRDYFYEKVNQTVQKNPDVEYCMVCSDIKDFKLVNDIFGINKGDEILTAIANAMMKLSTGKDTVYGRLSGDRFAIFMQRKRFNKEVFIKAIDSLSNLLGSSNYKLHVQVGVYDITDKEIEPSVMCDRAYMAITTIKSSLTAMIAHYNDDIREATLEEQKVTGEFSTALIDGQFCFYLQPQVSVKGKVLGGEALVRWLHPERGLVPPNDFIPVLERTGFICRLDMNTWELACRKLREWQDKGYTDYYISVNISPKDFYFTDIYKTFTELVERYKIPPRSLKLEITETAIMSDFKKQLVLIQRLREYGFCVEMDDFGSGYSSLNMLKDMSVDSLKVDMEFLRKTENPERTRTILKMIVSLSKQLGMEVITEGVETKEHVDFLTEIGTDIFQGYYFAKPMPVSEFEKGYLG